MKLKIFSLLLINTLLVCLTACSSYDITSETDSQADPQIEQWSDDERLSHAKKEFDNKNYEQSYRHLYPLAKKNNKEALYALGYQYYYGYGVEANPDTAQDLIRHSAELGYQPAIKALRLFVASQSTFTVDTKKPTYIADKTDETDTKLAKDTTNTTKNITVKPAPADKQIDKLDNQTIDEILESSTNSGSSNISNNITTVIKNDQNKGFNLVKQKTLPKADKPIEMAVNSNPDIKTENTNNTNNTKEQPIKTNSSSTKKDPELEKLIEKIEKHSSSETIWNVEKNTGKKSEPTAPQASQISKEPKNKLAVNNNWVTTQNPENYTIQVIAASDKEELNKFVIANNLQNKTKPFAYTYNNKTWYGLSFGVYNKPSEAYQALLDDLPSDIKLKKPWVRQFKNIVPASDIG